MHPQCRSRHHDWVKGYCRRCGKPQGARARVVDAEPTTEKGAGEMIDPGPRETNEASAPPQSAVAARFAAIRAERQAPQPAPMPSAPQVPKDLEIDDPDDDGSLSLEDAAPLIVAGEVRAAKGIAARLGREPRDPDEEDEDEAEDKWRKFFRKKYPSARVGVTWALIISQLLFIIAIVASSKRRARPAQEGERKQESAPPSGARTAAGDTRIEENTAHSADANARQDSDLGPIPRLGVSRGDA